MKKAVVRFLEMTGGIILLSAGAVLGIITGLGQTTSTGTSSAIALVLNIKVGTAMFLLYGLFIFLQIGILGTEFKWTGFFQLIPAGLQSLIMNYFRYKFAPFQWIVLDSYAERLLLFFLSVMLISLGFTIVKCSDFLNYPPEAFCTLIAEKFKIRFGTCKILLDFIYVAASLIICLSHYIFPDMVREGTLIFAVCNGCLINWYMPYVKKNFMKIENFIK